MSAMGHSLFEGEFHCQEYYKKHIHMPTSLARRKRPTEEFPDPLKANFTKKEVEKASTLKRGKPRVRTTTPERQQKRRKLFDTQLSEPLMGAAGKDQIFIQIWKVN